MPSFLASRGFVAQRSRARASEEKERLPAVYNKFRKVGRTFDGIQAQMFVPW